MNSKRRLVVGVALLAAAIVVALLLWRPPWKSGAQRTETPPPGRASTSSPTTAAPAPAPAPGEPEAPVTASPLRLAPAILARDDAATTGRFSGRVVNWGSGAGVAGAELVFSGPGAALTIRADAGGRFAFVPSELGSYQLATVSADGFLPYAPSWGESDVSLLARRGVSISGIIFYLTPAIEYSGRVVDRDGKAVSGAAVTILSAGRGSLDLMPIKDRFASDTDGRFTFSAPDFAVLEARHEEAGRGRAAVDSAVQVSHEMTIVVNPAAAMATVAGRVVDSAGAPVSDALVRLSVAPREGAIPLQVRATDDGAFSLEVPPGARYRVLARASGYAPGVATVDVGAASEKHEVEVLLEASAVIVGRVTSESGAVVPAFSVVVTRRVGVAETVVATTSVFDGDGTFEIDGFAPGPYLVSAAAYGFAPAPPVPATAAASADDATPVVIALPVGGTVTGRITDGVSGAPLELARVVAENSLGGGGSAMPIVSSVVTDADGRFELAGLPPGKASVVASAARHHSQIIGGLLVESGARIGPVEIELTPTKPGERPQLELAGIGAALAARDDGLVIQRLIDGGGAGEAGLVVGDIIVAVEGKPVAELGFQGAIQQIRGPVNTPVSLAIRRSGSKDVVELTAMRRKIRA